MSTPRIDAHRRHLIEAFAADVARARPESVLDVGCGEGHLGAWLEKEGVRVEGLERSERRLAVARERGRSVQQGDAHELPFAEGSFDTVVIRHVLHHMDDFVPPVAEALRVARSRVVLAEPCTDETLPGQSAMARLDLWLNELAARRGHVHQPYLGFRTMIEVLQRAVECVPGRAFATSFETRRYGLTTFATGEEVGSMIDKHAHGLELDEADQAQRTRFVQAAQKGEITYNGSLALFANLTL